MRSCTAFETCKSFSWTHAKFIAIDGREALVGGHNLWSEDYLVDNPVHDLSMLVRGPAAASASRFADRLWQFVCANLDKKAVDRARELCQRTRAWRPASVPRRSRWPARRARRPAACRSWRSDGSAPASPQDFANQSELARDLDLRRGAQRPSASSQQDIGFRFGRSDALFPESTLDRADRLHEQRDGHVYIVLSNPARPATAAAPTTTTSRCGPSRATCATWCRSASRRATPRRATRSAAGPDPVNALLCSHVHLAPLRFGPDATWPGGMTIANHAKLWMVDDRVFYIGSDNLYPVNLQEFGYIVDDRKAAAELLDAYWKPLWQWSRRAAVSGDGVETCIFRAPEVSASSRINCRESSAP